MLIFVTGCYHPFKIDSFGYQATGSVFLPGNRFCVFATARNNVSKYFLGLFVE
jgi:hypothetical protein